MKDASLAIPVYNEEDNLEKLLLKIKSSGLYDSLNHILIVDDNSTDDTYNKIKNLAKIYSKVIYRRNSKNMGQSYSIYFAAKILSEKILITIDGDCQNDPSDAIKLLEAYKNNPNIFLVGGIRTKRKDNFLKKVPLNLKTRQYLQDVYIEDIEKLSNLIDRDLTHWIKRVHS